jgi:CBS-domain-containing membrane protein
MKAKDVMTTRVVVVMGDTSVSELANRLLQHRVSAAPVVDKVGKLIGIVSEGDLLRHVGPERTPRSWWLGLFNEDAEAKDYIKAHGRHVRDVMTRDVISVTEDTPVAEIAELLETRQIKRVPVVRDGRVVGIVSRANLIHGLAAMRAAPSPATTDDDRLRAAIVAELATKDWSSINSTNVVVIDGVVEFWGIVGSEAEKEAARVAAENLPGVREVVDHRAVWSNLPAYL